MSSARDYYGKQCGLFAIVFIEQVVDCKAQEAGHKTNASFLRQLPGFLELQMLALFREWIMRMMEQAGNKNSNNQSFQLCQQHNQPIELTTVEMLRQKLDYIHNNPVIAGCVDKAEEYLYSSARDYYYGKQCGLFAIVSIEQVVDFRAQEAGHKTNASFLRQLPEFLELQMLALF